MATAADTRAVTKTANKGRPAVSLGDILRYIFLVLISIVAFMPFVLSFLGTFKTNVELTSFPPQIFPEQWRFDNWARVWNFSLPTVQNVVPRWIWNSTWLALVNVATARWPATPSPACASPAATSSTRSSSRRWRSPP
jgi:ABC-type glycerol-3-phosphate transport system permease component